MVTWDLSCEAAFSSSGPLSEPTYDTDLSDRLRKVSWTIGRTRDLDDWIPGGFQLEFDNSDRELDPEYTSGSYYGDLLPRVPVRISLTVDGATPVTHNLLHGFAGEDGWEQTYRPPAHATCSVRCTDLLGVLAGRKLPSVMAHAVLSLNPLHYWPLSDAGPSVADVAGGADGTAFDEPEFGQDPLSPGLGSSIEFDGVNDRIDLGRSPLVADTFATSTIVAVIRSDDLPTENVNIHPVFAQNNGQGPGKDTGITVYVDHEGHVRAAWFENGLAFVWISETAIDDGNGHLVIVQNNPVDVTDDGIAIDSSTLVRIASSSAYNGGNGTAIGGQPNAAKDFSDNHFVGAISDVAIWDSLLDSSDRAVIVAGFESWNGDGTGERIEGVVGDLVGVPSALLDADAGVTTLGAAITEDEDALTYVQTVARTESGILTIAHHDEGQLKFIDRASILTGTRHTTSQATFTDSSSSLGAGEYRYEPDLVVEPASINSVINRVTVSYIGGSITVEDATSVAAYGPRGRSFSTLHETPAEATSFAEYVLDRYKDPITRVRQLTIDCAGDANNLDAALSLRIGDRVTVVRKPQNIGNEMSEEMLIEGISGEIANGVSTFRVTYYLSPADTAEYALWGSGTWDSALWAY